MQYIYSFSYLWAPNSATPDPPLDPDADPDPVMDPDPAPDPVVDPEAAGMDFRPGTDSELDPEQCRCTNTWKNGFWKWTTGTQAE